MQLSLTQNKEKKESVFCKIICGDSREVLPGLKEKADLIVTSPPYADARSRHYDSIHPDLYMDWFSSFHKPFYDALNEKGNFVLNIKDKIVDGTRHRFVWATVMLLQQSGWNAIDDYIWIKPNPMPGYWPTRLRDGWEYCFHFAKDSRPFINQSAVKVPIGNWNKVRLAKLTGKSAIRHNSENDSGFGRDLRNWVGKDSVLPSNVLNLPLVGKNYGHPATFPIALPEFFIKLLSPEKGLVIDPFGGSGTTAIASLKLKRNVLLIDNNRKYCEVAYKRIQQETKGQNVKIVKENF